MKDNVEIRRLIEKLENQEVEIRTLKKMVARLEKITKDLVRRDKGTGNLLRNVASDVIALKAKFTKG